jgi:hypothetical protein
VKRRRKELGLLGSGVNTRTLPEGQRRQLVLDQMNADPRKHLGVKSVQAKIAFETGEHIKR